MFVGNGGLEMYVRITSRCNMKCAHCCYSCGPRGRDMSLETFKKAATLSKDKGEGLFLGGGEPLLHPQFWEILGLALGSCADDVWVGLITNGKVKDRALAVAGLARRGALYAGLSRDQWHEDISPEVVKAFTRDAKRAVSRDDPNDMRDIRDGETVYPVGRGVEVATDDEGCVCPDLLVEPDGTVWGCGCRKTKVGTVDGLDLPAWYDDADYERGECFEKNKAKAEADVEYQKEEVAA